MTRFANVNVLVEPVWSVELNGLNNQATNEGTLKAGTLIKDCKFWDEGAMCDPEGYVPVYAEPETYTFLASTDGGKSFFLQRSYDAPVTCGMDEAEKILRAVFQHEKQGKQDS